MCFERGPEPFSASPGGLSVRVRLRPRGRRDAIEGLVQDADGVSIKASVSAPPEAGKANAALVELLAREWGLARRAVAIERGHKSRRKTVRVAGDPNELLPLLEAWLARRLGDTGPGHQA